jgi:hypothetical protein
LRIGGIKCGYFAIVVTGVALTVHVAPARSEEESFGVGGHLCTAFAGFRAKSPDAEPLFFTWAQGFMVAWNMASEKPVLKVDTTAMTLDKQRKFLIDYCEIHPTDMYLQAVTALLAKLKYEKARKTGKAEE